jgi:nucleotide-binding universal stress UspA family protein
MMIALTHILVATDFEDAAEAAFTYGRGLARAFKATLHVVHVVDDVASRAAAMAGYGIDFDKLQADVEGSARKQLEELLSDEDRAELHATAVVLSSPSPAQAVVDYAAEHQINLIVVGTHGRGPVAKFFVGSVAERVGRIAPCPVLIVRHPEREFVLPDALQRTARA